MYSSYVSSSSLIRVTWIIIYICIYCIYYHTLVDCEWAKWVEGDCSTTCGAGKQNNTRSKIIEEANGGNCTGESTEVQSCLVVECPGK